MEMKKYTTPEMETVEIKMQHHLLQSSEEAPGTGVGFSRDAYIDE